MHINDNTNQTILPLELSACLPQDHVVFTIEQVVKELDDHHFQTFYPTFGRPSYHPKLLLSALLFAYSRGTFSGRKIQTMMAENLGMDDLIAQLFVEMSLRLKMAELVTLDCLYIDGTKIEANANKYSFVWRKAIDKFSAKLQTDLRSYFQEDISPLIHEAIELDEQSPISSEQLAEFTQLIEEELVELNQAIAETPIKSKDERKTKRRKLKKVLRKVKDDFSVRAEKYESYQDTFAGFTSLKMEKRVQIKKWSAQAWLQAPNRYRKPVCPPLRCLSKPN